MSTTTSTSRRCATLSQLLALSALAATVPLAQAQYKVVGADGKVTYTDRAPNSNEGRVTALGARSQAEAAVEPELPFELRQVASKYPVTLYTTTGVCDACAAGRQLLRQRGVPYTERQAVTSEDVDALEKLSGGRDAPTLTIAIDSGSRLTFGTCSNAPTDSSSPAATSTARGSGDGGSFIHASALRPCQTRDHTDASPIVVRRRPVSLFFRLVPYSTLNTPVYHHVRAANSATPAANVPRYNAAPRKPMVASSRIAVRAVRHRAGTNTGMGTVAYRFIIRRNISSGSRQWREYESWNLEACGFQRCGKCRVSWRGCAGGLLGSRR